MTCQSHQLTRPQSSPRGSQRRHDASRCNNRSIWLRKASCITKHLCPFRPPNSLAIVAAQAPVDSPLVADLVPGYVSQEAKHDLDSQQHHQPCPCPEKHAESKNAASEEGPSHPFSGRPPKPPCRPPSSVGSPGRVVPFPLPRWGEGCFPAERPQFRKPSPRNAPSPASRAVKRCRARLPLLILLALPSMLHKPHQAESREPSRCAQPGSAARGTRLTQGEQELQEC